MRKSTPVIGLAMLALALVPAMGAVATDSPVHGGKKSLKLSEERPGLAKKALIPLKQARATAMSKVPKGVIRAQEIEEENGRLIYSFDLKVKGIAGIEEVNVNAMSGDFVNSEHEGAGAEAKEKAADKAEAKTDAAESGASEEN